MQDNEDWVRPSPKALACILYGHALMYLALPGTSSYTKRRLEVCLDTLPEVRMSAEKKGLVDAKNIMFPSNFSQRVFQICFVSGAPVMWGDQVECDNQLINQGEEGEGGVANRIRGALHEF